MDIKDFLDALLIEKLIDTKKSYGTLSHKLIADIKLTPDDLDKYNKLSADEKKEREEVEPLLKRKKIVLFVLGGTGDFRVPIVLGLQTQGWTVFGRGWAEGSQVKITGSYKGSTDNHPPKAPHKFVWGLTEVQRYGVIVVNMNDRNDYDWTRDNRAEIISAIIKTRLI